MPAPIVAIIIGAAARQLAKMAAKRAAARLAQQYVKKQLKKKIDDAIKKAAEKLKKAAEDRAKNCKTCKPDPDPCRALKKGDPDGSGTYRGGSYGGTRGQGALGRDSNHMPADSASPMRKSQGPSIQMERGDHGNTRSYGGGTAADNYRLRQERLIEAGKMEEAFAMDVADVMRIAAEGGDVTKYADAIAEAAAYLWCLKKHGLA
jgi:hypothetical protein